jgi:hypothetical protein
MGPVALQQARFVMRLKKIIISCCILGVSLHAFGGFSETYEVAKKNDLGVNAVWLKLLRYPHTGKDVTRYESEVISEDFFLSNTGQTNPESELEATLKAIFSPSPAIQDDHAQCRFRGRYIWLKRMIGFDGEPKVDCAEFNKFSSAGSVGSVSLVLATGYLGNPASYYGHVLLKFNSQKFEANNGLLDESVNFGAIIPDGTDPVSYIFKGVTGGYEGGFTHIQYYFHNHNYGENELRDLWEYELNLSAEDVELVVAHAWEMIGKKYQYYFFRKNCAYRIAEIVEAATGLQLVPESRPYTVPQALIQNIAQQIVSNGDSLVKKVSYHPSRQSDLYAKYRELSAIETRAVELLVEDTDNLKAKSYLSLSMAQRQRVVDVLLDYYRFYLAADTEDESLLSQRNSYQDILKERFSLDSALSSQVVSRPVPPDGGREPSLFRFGLSHQSRQSVGALVHLRPAYYDALDAGPGHVKYAHLSMLETELTVSSGNAKISYLDLVSIESVSPGITRLPGDRGESWRLKFGFERQAVECSSCLVFRAQGDVGLSKELFDGFLLSGYVGGGIQENRNSNGVVFGRVVLSASYIKGKFAGRLGVEPRYHFDSNLHGELTSYYEMRYELSGGQELRVRYDKNVGEQIRIGYGVYW